MEKDIDKMTRELQYAQQDAQSEQTQLTNELQTEFQTKLNPIIDQVAKEKGLQLVLSIADSGAVWADTGLNISAEVIKRLDANKAGRCAAAREVTSDRSVNIPQVIERLCYRYPSPLVDAVIEFEPGRRIVAVKNVTVNEDFFQGHFPGEPLMPGCS